MSGLSRQILVISLLITGAGEIALSSEETIQYTAEGFGIDELDEIILN